MNHSSTAALLSEIAAPLNAKFGDLDLTVCRAGDAVRWGYAGQSAIIEFSPEGLLRATFIDSEGVDIVSACPAAAVYRTRAAYALNHMSCGRMVADLVDFFSGVREPKFTFVDAYTR